MNGTAGGVLGACCYLNRSGVFWVWSCLQTWEVVCASKPRSHWYGDGTWCYNVSCPWSSIRACCIGNECFEYIPSDCEAHGGTPHVDAITCSGIDCGEPEEEYACCINYGCYLRSGSRCMQSGGQFHYGLSCSQVSCAGGSCCLCGGDCTYQNAAWCGLYGVPGTFYSWGCDNPVRPPCHTHTYPATPVDAAFGVTRRPPEHEYDPGPTGADPVVCDGDFELASLFEIMPTEYEDGEHCRTHYAGLAIRWRDDPLYSDHGDFVLRTCGQYRETNPATRTNYDGYLYGELTGMDLGIPEGDFAFATDYRPACRNDRWLP